MSGEALDIKSYILQFVDNEIEGVNKVFSLNDEELAGYRPLLQHFEDTNTSNFFHL